MNSYRVTRRTLADCGGTDFAELLGYVPNIQRAAVEARRALKRQSRGLVTVQDRDGLTVAVYRKDGGGPVVRHE